MVINMQNIPSEPISTFKMEEMNNRKLIVQQIYKYIDFKESVATKKLLMNDLIRSQFKSSTLANYMRGIRCYIKSKAKPKICPAYVYEIVEQLIAKKYPRLRPSEDDKLIVITHNENEIKNHIETKFDITSVIQDKINQLANKKNELKEQLITLDNQINAMKTTLTVLKGESDEE